jgi:hypothetical protein
MLASRRSLRRVGADPVSWIAAHPPEIKVRLGLIKVPRIEAGAVGRPHFPVVHVGHMEATARTAGRSHIYMPDADTWRGQQFGGKDGRCRDRYRTRNHQHR